MFQPSSSILWEALTYFVQVLEIAARYIYMEVSSFSPQNLQCPQVSLTFPGGRFPVICESFHYEPKTLFVRFKQFCECFVCYLTHGTQPSTVPFLVSPSSIILSSVPLFPNCHDPCQTLKKSSPFLTSSAAASFFSNSTWLGNHSIQTLLCEPGVLNLLNHSYANLELTG